MTDTDKPRAKGDMKCPLWQKKMSLVCHTCEWWVHVRGKHPQGEELVDHWGCAIAFMPMLMIENSQMQRQTGAAVESFRNETVKMTQINLTSLVRRAAVELTDDREQPYAIDHRPE